MKSKATRLLCITAVYLNVCTTLVAQVQKGALLDTKTLRTGPNGDNFEVPGGRIWEILAIQGGLSLGDIQISANPGWHPILLPPGKSFRLQPNGIVLIHDFTAEPFVSAATSVGLQSNVNYLTTNLFQTQMELKATKEELLRSYSTNTTILLDAVAQKAVAEAGKSRYEAEIIDLNRRITLLEQQSPNAK